MCEARFALLSIAKPGAIAPTPAPRQRRLPIKFLAKGLLTKSPDVSKILDSPHAFEQARKQLERDGVGARSILAFLKDTPGITTEEQRRSSTDAPGAAFPSQNSRRVRCCAQPA
jgi:hypothetical protein